MKTHWGMRFAVVAGFMAALGLSGYAVAATEVDDALNNDIGNAQALEFDATGTATVDGTLLTDDVDFYSFTVNANDQVTFDIGDGSGTWVDTQIAILGPSDGAIPYRFLTGIDDSGSTDANSSSPYDPYLTYKFTDAGTYYVAVFGSFNTVDTGGVYTGGVTQPVGTYKLIVSGVTATSGSGSGSTDTGSTDPGSTDPTVMQINIDIKPGHRGRAFLHPGWHQTIPVALLSSDDFDATAVDRSSLTFGHTGDEQSLRWCAKHGADYNGDGRRDLLCFFENRLAGFEASDEMATIKGQTGDSTEFEGQGALKVVVNKRRDWRHGGERHGRHEGDDHGHHGHKGRR